MDRGTWKFYFLQDIAKTVSFTDFCNKLLMWRSRGGKMTGIKNTKSVQYVVHEESLFHFGSVYKPRGQNFGQF